MLRLSVSKGHTKMMMAKLTAILFISLTVLAASKANQQPNIIIVLADDFGWNDIGYHNPEVISPNLDQLAREGVSPRGRWSGEHTGQPTECLHCCRREAG